MTKSNNQRYFMIVPYGCDSPTPVFCNDPEGFAESWFGNRKLGSRIRQLMGYRPPSSASFSTSQKLGNYQFFPVDETEGRNYPPEPRIAQPHGKEKAEKLFRQFRQLSRSQIIQCLLLLESDGLDTALRYCEFCLHPSDQVAS